MALTPDNCMQEKLYTKEQLLAMLQEELEKLLASDDIPDDEKLARIKTAQTLIENGRA